MINVEVDMDISCEEEQFLVTYLKKFASRPIVVPTIYAVRFFCNELESALSNFVESPALMDLLASREEEKVDIQQSLHRIQMLFNKFLMNEHRR